MAGCLMNKSDIFGQDMEKENSEDLSVEQLLQRKLEEYRQAELEGRGKDDLLMLYKEIKRLQYQFLVSHPNYQYWLKRGTLGL